MLPLRADNWSQKAIRRKTTGTGRMRYMKDLPRRFKNGFREGELRLGVFLGPSGVCCTGGGMGSVPGGHIPGAAYALRAVPDKRAGLRSYINVWQVCKRRRRLRQRRIPNHEEVGREEEGSKGAVHGGQRRD